MEIVRMAYRTRRSAALGAGTTSPAADSISTPSTGSGTAAPKVTTTESPATASTSAAPSSSLNNTTTSSSSSPATGPGNNSMSPVVVLKKMTMRTRRSAGRVSPGPAAAETLSAPSSSSSAAEEETKNEVHTSDSTLLRSSSSSTTQQQSTRRSGRTNRGSSSSSSSSITTISLRSSRRSAAVQAKAAAAAFKKVQEDPPSHNNPNIDATPEEEDPSTSSETADDNKNGVPSPIVAQIQVKAEDITVSAVAANTHNATTNANGIAGSDKKGGSQEQVHKEIERNESRRASQKVGVSSSAQPAALDTTLTGQEETVTVPVAVVVGGSEETECAPSQATEVKKDATSTSSLLSAEVILKIERGTQQSLEAREDSNSPSVPSGRHERKELGAEGDRDETKEVLLPPKVFVDGNTGVPVEPLESGDNACNTGTSGTCTVNTHQGLSCSANSEDSLSDRSYGKGGSPEQVSSVHGTTFCNQPDVSAIEDGEVFTANIPTREIESATNSLPGLPTSSPSGRRKTKLQAVTYYGGESTVGFVNDNRGSQAKMEVGHRHQIQAAPTNGTQGVTPKGELVALKSGTGGDVSSSSSTVPLEVPSGSIDPKDFGSHLDEQSMTVLENVLLRSDQGQHLVTEVMGCGMDMDVISVADSAGESGDSSSAARWDDASRAKDEAVVSSSGALIPSGVSSDGNTPGIDNSPSAVHRGPGRPSGRPGSGGRGGKGSTTTPMSQRALLESDPASIRRSRRQQDRIEKLEVERILAENLLMLQREKEQMQAAALANKAQLNDKGGIKPQKLPVHLGIVSSTQAITPLAGVDSTSGIMKRPVRKTKLSAHLADQNYLGLEEASSHSSRQQDFGDRQAYGAAELSQDSLDIMEMEDSQGAMETEEEIDNEGTEDDPDRLWCICRMPHNNRFMICCDKCEEWFHGTCVGITKSVGKKIELSGKSWHCPLCKKKAMVAERKEHHAQGKQKPKEGKVGGGTGPGRKSAGDLLAASQVQMELKQSQPAKSTPQQKQKQEITKVVTSSPKQYVPTPPKQVSSGNRKQAKLTATAAAQKAEADAAASIAISAQPPRKIAAAAAANRGRAWRKSEKAEQEDPRTACTVCKRPARTGSAYCSDLCVQKYASAVSSAKTSPSAKDKAVLSSPVTSPTSTVPVPTAPMESTSATDKSPNEQAKLKRSQSMKETNPDPIFNFHVINVGTSVSTVVVPAMRKELTASVLLKAQKEKAQQDRVATQADIVQQQSPTPGSISKTPSGTISPASTSIISQLPTVATIQGAAASRKTRTVSTSSSTTSGVSVMIVKKVESSGMSETEKKAVKSERSRASSLSSSEGHGRKSRSSPSGSSSSGKGSKEKQLERRESSSGSSEHLNRDSMRKSLKEVFKKRIAKLSSSDKKNLATTGLTAGQASAKIEEELVAFFGGASNAKCKSKYRSIYFNLKAENNDTLFREILLGNIKAADLVRMTPDQMAPSELAQWRKEEEEKGLERIKRAELDKLAEAKKQELLDKGVENAVQVAEESKLLDINDVIVNPEEEKKREKSSKESSSKHRSHHHRDKDRDRSDRTRDKDRDRSDRHRDKDRGRSDRHRDKDRDRSDRHREKDRSRSSHDKDRDKHRHSDREKDSDRKSERELERHSSSSRSSRGHKSSHHDKDKKSERDRERRNERPRDKDKNSSSSSSSSKVKHASKESRSERDRDRSSRHARSKERERHRDKDKEKEIPVKKSDEKPEENPQPQPEKSPKSDKKEQESDPVAPTMEEPAITTASVGASSLSLSAPSTSSVETAELSGSVAKVSSPAVLTMDSASNVEEKKTDPTASVGESQDMHHSSVDSEQELPSSTIKTPDFTDGPGAGSVGQKEGGDDCIFQSTLQMADVGEFKSAFYAVSHDAKELSGALFPESPVSLVGRSSPQIVYDYINKMKKSKDIIIFRMAPASSAHNTGYMNFFTYLESRGRIGVIGGICHPLKDVYLIPLAKYNPVPPCLLPFRGPGLPAERKHHYLLAVVTRHMISESAGLKRKLSSTSESVSKRLKATTMAQEIRILKSDSFKLSEIGSPAPAILAATRTLPSASAKKGNENEPYTPWEDEDVLMEPAATSAAPEASLKEKAAEEQTVMAKLQEVNAEIEKRKKDISSISSVLAGAKNVEGIPGLDGDFPEEGEISSISIFGKASASPTITPVTTPGSTWFSSV